MSVMLLWKNTSIHPTTSYKSLLSQYLVIPVIFSQHRTKWIQLCDPKLTSECLSRGTGRHQQMGCRVSWDINNSLQTPESCLQPTTRNCLKLFCQNTCSFLSTESVFRSSQQIQKRLDSLLCVFPLFWIETPSDPVQCVQHFRGGRWQCATSYIKSGYSYLLCAGFMKPVCCFVCHDGEMKVCFAVAPSLFGEQAQTGWLQFACSSVAEMDGWHVWFH